MIQSVVNFAFGPESMQLQALSPSRCYDLSGTHPESITSTPFQIPPSLMQVMPGVFVRRTKSGSGAFLSLSMANVEETGERP